MAASQALCPGARELVQGARLRHLGDPESPAGARRQSKLLHPLRDTLLGLLKSCDRRVGVPVSCTGLEQQVLTRELLGKPLAPVDRLAEHTERGQVRPRYPGANAQGVLPLGDPVVLQGGRRRRVERGSVYRDEFARSSVLPERPPSSLRLGRQSRRSHERTICGRGCEAISRTGCASLPGPCTRASS